MASDKLFIEVNYEQLNKDYQTKFLNTTEKDAIDSTSKPSVNQEFGLLNNNSDLAIYDNTVDKINIEWVKPAPADNQSPPEFKIKNIHFLKTQTNVVSKVPTPPEYTYAIQNLSQSNATNNYNLKMAPPVAGQSGGTAKKTRIKRKKTKIVKRAKTLRGKRHNLLRSSFFATP